MKASHEDYSVTELLFEILKELKTPKAADLGLISNEDACEALKVSRWTMKALRDSGRLPWVKYGVRYFYRISDVNSMVEKDFKENVVECA